MKLKKKQQDTSSFVTTVLNTKISEVDSKIHDHSKYSTIPEFSKLRTENFTARLKQVNLVNKTNFDNKLSSFNRKIISNKTE